MQLHTKMMLCWHVIYDDHDCCDWLVVDYTVYFGTFPISTVMLPDFQQKYANYVA